MKILQSMIIATSIILISADLTADPLRASFNELVQSSTNTLTMSPAQNKQAAYQLGHKRLTQLNGMSSEKLSNTLHIDSSNLNGDKLHLKDGGYVTVEERMNAGGKVIFVF